MLILAALAGALAGLTGAVTPTLLSAVSLGVVAAFGVGLLATPSVVSRHRVLELVLCAACGGIASGVPHVLALGAVGGALVGSVLLPLCLVPSVIGVLESRA